ncbi:MAG: aspartyl protease family protein [Planctomycetes bacterium]|nr:aspartyl protease family protein [Planctomycetota bacterium]MBL7145112.1 aspartyl protease family protein [Phycisphaerae bacterium]
MKRKNQYNQIRVLFTIVSAIVVFSVSFAHAGRTGWKRQEVDWRTTGGGRVKAIRYSEDKEPSLYNGKAGNQPDVVRKRILRDNLPSEEKSFSLLSIPSVMANVIDSPPIDGFVPRIVVSVTDKGSDDFDWVAEAHMSVVGRHLTDNPETDFTIGLFDTGASAHIISYAGANRTGIYEADLITSSMTEILGATNSVFGWVSKPLAVFADGLAAIEPNGMTLDSSNMVGQSNVSVIIGDLPPEDKPDLPTVLGSPMSVNFVTVINNDLQITVTYDGNDLTSPDIKFYEHDDSRIPDYANRIPLNLIPSGAQNIQYIPDLEAIMEFIFQPGTPSIIVGNSAQSLFFVDSVDLRHNERSAIDKTRFMLDTGAQITVISSGVASRLGLNPNNADFEAEIQDVTGEITLEPGFYIDSLEIPSLGEWLSFTNVPVVLLDVSSPEGGTLEGIIGMNLFINFNLVLRGGGLMGQDPPSLEFELITKHLIADIAPEGGDGIVDFLDFDAFANAWLSTTTSPNWNPAADLAPTHNPDGIIDTLDLSIFFDNWLKTASP